MHDMSTILSDYTLVSDSRKMPTIIRMAPGRPKKEFKNTYRGKREAKKMAKMEIKLERDRQKQRTQLTILEKGVIPDGNISTHSKVGWKYEKQIVNEPKPEPELEWEFESETEEEARGDG